MLKSAIRAVMFVVVPVAMLCSAIAQSASTADSPKQTEHFTLQLNRDRNAQELAETMKEQTEARQARDFHVANQSPFDRTLDLLRFVPFKLSSGDIKAEADDFFTPNYLRADYNRRIPDSELFDSR